MEQEQITKTKEKEFQVVKNPVVARKLLKLGYTICDIKPNKENPKVSTVFVFKNNEKFQQDYNELNKKK